MSKRILAMIGLAVAISVTPLASAHNDSPDPTRCDTWWRNGHQSGTGSDTTSHHHTRPGEDVDINDPINDTYIHKHPLQGDPGDVGHYVVRGSRGYVEVVGGGSYQRPNLPGGGNQGGYVQGEVDPTGATGTPDADFHVSTFSGTNNANNAGMLPGPVYTEANVCLTVWTPFGPQTIERWHNENNPGT